MRKKREEEGAKKERRVYSKQKKKSVKNPRGNILKPCVQTTRPCSRKGNETAGNKISTSFTSVLSGAMQTKVAEGQIQ